MLTQFVRKTYSVFTASIKCEVKFFGSSLPLCFSCFLYRSHYLCFFPITYCTHKHSASLPAVGRTCCFLLFDGDNERVKDLHTYFFLEHFHVHLEEPETLFKSRLCYLEDYRIKPFITINQISRIMEEKIIPTIRYQLH